MALPAFRRGERRSPEWRSSSARSGKIVSVEEYSGTPLTTQESGRIGPACRLHSVALGFRSVVKHRATGRQFWSR